MVRSASDQDVRREWPQQAIAERHASGSRTFAGERVLLFTTALILPLESHLPTVAGNSILFVVFAVLAGYVAIHRLQYLDRIWLHPVFVASYAFIAISALVELASPLTSYHLLSRFAQTIGGALLVGSLCRDRDGLKTFLYGYIAAALWLGLILFLTSYGKLSAMAPTNYQEASQVRAEAFSETPISGNLNTFGYTCLQGGVVALAFALGSSSVYARNIFAVIGTFCLVATFLTMSRMAFIIAIVSYGLVLKTYGIKHGKVWLLACLIAGSAVFLLPNAIWSRMTFMIGEEQKDSRTALYQSAFENFGDYWFMGIGEGNYYQKWGFEKGFAMEEAGMYIVPGVHNTFVQLLIFWGVFSVLAYLLIIWQAYRCLPSRYEGDSLALSLLGVAVSFLLMLPFTHNFEAKQFSLVLGMLVAHQRWLRDPGHIGQPTKQSSRPGLARV